MLRIDLRRLKLHPRDSEAFYLQARGSDSILEEIGGKFLVPIEVEIVVENTGTIFVGRGKVSTLLQLPCSRCLKDFTYPVNTEIDLEIAENINSEQFPAEEGFILFNGEWADIGARVEEAIFMAIGICPLCQEDCLGLCPVCGQDKNTANCFCQDETVDPRWEKLKNLK